VRGPTLPEARGSCAMQAIDGRVSATRRRLPEVLHAPRMAVPARQRPDPGAFVGGRRLLGASGRVGPGAPSEPGNHALRDSPAQAWHAVAARRTRRPQPQPALPPVCWVQKYKEGCTLLQQSLVETTVAAPRGQQAEAGPKEELLEQDMDDDTSCPGTPPPSLPSGGRGGSSPSQLLCRPARLWRAQCATPSDGRPTTGVGCRADRRLQRRHGLPVTL
jgi:hypothetical protein